MGNTTERIPSVDEALARVGSALRCQRVELYRIGDADATLVAQWTPFDPAARVVVTGPTTVPIHWFPWSLGNIRPEEYMFIRNAGPLPLSTHGGRITDLAMASSLHLPLLAGQQVFGAVCAYWVEERSSWPSESRPKICSWAAEALASVR